jgi:intracellular septation protein A
LPRLDEAGILSGMSVPPSFDDTVAAPTLLSVIRRIGWRGFFDAVVPVALFLVLNVAAGIVAAMLAATAWAIAIGVWRMVHERRTGVLIWIGLAYVLARGAAGVLTQSKVVFFGPGVAQTGLIGLVFLVSVILRRPAVGYIAPIIYPFQDYVRRHPAYRRAFSRLTLIWASYLLAKVALDVWLLTSLSASMFVLVRSIVSWPILLGLFVFSLRYPRRVFRREPDLVPYVEAAERQARPVPAV